MAHKVARASPKLDQEDRAWGVWEMGKRCPGNLKLVGYNRHLDRRFLYVPELKLCLDAGLCRGRQFESLFVTRAHRDYIKDIPWLSKKAGGVTIYCPAPSAPLIYDYIKAEWDIDGAKPADEVYFKNFTFIRCSDTEAEPSSYDFCKGKYRATVIADCAHQVGYCFDERRRSLKPEYQGLPGKELGRLKKEGAQIDEERFLPLFIYAGGSGARALLKHEARVATYPVAIVECNYFHDEHVELAASSGASHWKEFRPLLERNKTTQFVLTGFARCYSEREVFDFFDNVINTSSLSPSTTTSPTTSTTTTSTTAIPNLTLFFCGVGSLGSSDSVNN